MISERIDKMLKSLKARQENARRIDRNLGRYAEKLSRFIWLWRESRLLVLVFAVAVCDFLSTYLGLNFKSNTFESGSLARWALNHGGYFRLISIDLAVAGGLSAIALALRSYYTRIGSPDYGRAAFVLVLLPYAFIAALAVINNMLFVLGLG